MWSFCRLCQSAAAPRSKGSGCAAELGFEVTAVGDCAITSSDRNGRGSVHPTATRIMGSILLGRDVILPPLPVPKYLVQRSVTAGIAGHNPGLRETPLTCKSGIPNLQIFNQLFFSDPA